MTLDELKGLSPTEAIAKAAAFAGVSPSTVDAQWRVESNRGAHPTMTNPKSTAKGHFQFLDGTHNTWESRLGRKLDRFDFSEALFEYSHQMKENMKATGNEQDAVRMFYRGTDRSLWNDAGTQDYTAKVFGANQPASVASNRVAPVKSDRPAAELMRMRGVDVAKAYADAPPMARPDTVFTPIQPRLNAVPEADAFVANRAVDASGAKLSNIQAAKDNTEFGGINDRESVLGSSYAKTLRPMFDFVGGFGGDEPADPEHMKDLSRNWPEYMAGLTENERDRVAGTRNKGEFDHAMFRITEDRADDMTKAKAGTMSNLGADLMAGVLDPTTWATGMAAAKAFAVAGIGAQAAIRAGRPVAAALSAAGENVVGNLAWDGLQQAVGEHKSIHDYALSAVTGLIPSVIGSPIAYRQGLGAFKEGIMRNVAEKNIALAREAQLNIGEGATPELLRTEMSRIEAEQIKTQRTQMSAAAPEADRINAPNLDEVAPEIKGEQSAFPTIDTAMVDTGVASARQVVPTAETPYSAADIWQRVEQQNRTAPEKLTRFGVDGNVDTLVAAGPGTHLSAALVASKADNKFLYETTLTSLETLRKQIAPELNLHLAEVPVMKLPNGKSAQPEGIHYPVAANTSVIAVRPGSDMANTLVHEFGHAVSAHYLKDVPFEIRKGVLDEFAKFAKVYDKPGAFAEALLTRGGLKRADGAPLSGKESLRAEQLRLGGEGQAKYMGEFEEWAAEQMLKYVESGAAKAGPGANLTLTSQLKNMVSDLFNRLLKLFNLAKQENMLRASEGFEKFIDHLRSTATKGEAAGVPNMMTGEVPAQFAMPAGGFNGQPNSGPQPGRISGADFATAQKYGLDLMPQTTPREKAEFKATLDIYRKAEAWGAANPRDDSKLKLLGNNSLMNVALPATLLATSDNPVARMIAGTLLEQSTGAQGRRATAAIAKVMLEEKYIGNALIDYDRFYTVWRNENGGGVIEDFAKRKVRENFNRTVMLEREARLRGVVNTDVHPMVKQAADTMDAAFERARVDQVEIKTVGWARMPESAVGYTPHQIAAARLQSATDAELRVFQGALTEQFKRIEGWDDAFAEELGRKYLDHARVNANGGHEIPSNVHNPQAASMVQGAMEAMGMDKAEVAAMMGRYAAGGPSHTKKRVHLDLTTEYPDGNGGTMTLMNLFNTDQVGLLRSYARRVSGEVALAQYGVMGSQGMSLLRRSLDFGPKVDAGTMKAFDQVAAELLDKPFGTSIGKTMDRVLTVNASAKLGGMGYPQLGESLNAIWSVGAGHALAAIKAMPRLRGEVAALARGEKIENGILSSMEAPGGGGEFGLEGYKMVTAFDSPEQAFNSYGHDASTWFDRAARGAAHAQGTLSMHRMIQAVQVRGVAEQITLKAIKYIREGGEDVALRDMGFTPDMVAKLRADLPNMVVYDAGGRVKEFDVTKATDVQAATQFMQAVRRGAGQIIQRSYIGEQGKWAHDGFLRILTQFKSYPLVAMEKQWGRNKANYGVMGAFGILLGGMSMAVPLYYARVALASIGREDRDAYMEKALTPEAIARATMNYVGSAGMAPELMDQLSNITGVGQPAGTRAGGGKGFVSTMVPAAGYIDDAYKAALNPSDPHKAVQLLPWSRTPGLIPLVNMMRND